MTNENRLFLGGKLHGEVRPIDSQVKEFVVFEPVVDVSLSSTLLESGDLTIQQKRYHLEKFWVNLYGQAEGHRVMVYEDLSIKEAQTLFEVWYLNPGDYKTTTPPYEYFPVLSSGNSTIVEGGAGTDLQKTLQGLIPGLDEWLYGKNPDCCESPLWGYTIRSVIIHLNDVHEWSFDDIADWLDTLDVDLSVKS